MMDRPDDLRQRGDRIMRTTRWSMVRRAVNGGSALDEWLSASWYPLYVLARQKQLQPEDAADSVQDFVSKICSRGLLEQLDPSRGKLRSWLFASFSNHISTMRARASARKRGGGVRHLQIDREGLETFYQSDMSTMSDTEKAYSRAWALTLMDEALIRLENHYEGDGRVELFNALLPALESPLPDSTYEETAGPLGLSGAALRQAAVRFRQRYRQLLLDVAGERLGISCEAKLAEELRDLLGS